MAIDKSRVSELQAGLSDVSVDLLGRSYTNLREREAKLSASIEEELSQIAHAKAAIEWEIRGRLNTQGLKSFKLASGSNFHIREQTNYTIANLDTFYVHLEERRKDGETTAVYGAFPKRITKDYVKAWMEGHDGELPPGLDVITERKIIFQQRG